jgi:hypothetical protein
MLVSNSANTKLTIVRLQRVHDPHFGGGSGCSRRLEGDVEELGGRFPVLQAFGNDAERKCLDDGHCFITILPIAQHAGQSGNLGNPATVLFAFEFDREGHAAVVASRPGILQAAGRTARMRNAAMRSAFALKRYGGTTFA